MIKKVDRVQAVPGVATREASSRIANTGEIALARAQPDIEERTFRLVVRDPT